MSVGTGFLPATPWTPTVSALLAPRQPHGRHGTAILSREVDTGVAQCWPPCDHCLPSGASRWPLPAERCSEGGKLPHCPQGTTGLCRAAAAVGECGQNRASPREKTLGSLAPRLQAPVRAPQRGALNCSERPVLCPGAGLPRWATPGLRTPGHGPRLQEMVIHTHAAQSDGGP